MLVWINLQVTKLYCIMFQIDSISSCEYSMPAASDHANLEKSRSARLYIASQRARQRRCLCTPAWTFASLHQRRGRPCPSTQTIAMEANPTRIGCAPEPCRPGPALGAPCPRDPRIRTFASRYPRPGAFEPLDPDQPSAVWTRARVIAPLDQAPGGPSPPGPPRGSCRSPVPATGRALPDFANSRTSRSRTGARSRRPDPSRAGGLAPWRSIASRQRL